MGPPRLYSPIATQYTFREWSLKRLDDRKLVIYLCPCYIYIYTDWWYELSLCFINWHLEIDENKLYHTFLPAGLAWQPGFIHGHFTITSLIMFSEVLKLPSSHCSPLSFSKLLGKPPQEALKVNLIAPMALMQARDILGIWSFGVIGGRAGRVFIYNKPTNTARQSWATCSPSASFEIFEMVIARGRRERERGICIFIYIYIHICVCMCVYIYICTYISCIAYGQIWSYMVLYIYLQMIHVLSLDSCNFTDMTRPCAQGAAASATSCPAAVCCTWGPPWHIIRRKGRPRDTARRQWKLRTLEVELFIDLWSTIVNKWLITVHNVYWIYYWWIMVNNG